MLILCAKFNVMLRFFEGICMMFFFFLAEIYALSSNDIKVGSNLEVDGAPWKVLGNSSLCCVIKFLVIFMLL